MLNRVEEIFSAVADLAPQARDKYFREHEIEAAIRREVLALLAFDSKTVSISLKRNIAEVAEGTLDDFDSRDPLCGAYKLGKLLGRGGMGTVYEAQRVDGEVTQRVAVKLLRPGTDDPRIRLRFLAERQILAALSHRNIARMLDAGHRQDGQPYLVMEYVEGKPIDVYASGFSMRQKIGLFLKVCAAVGYLHRNLVVHRDLKPGNILVTKEGEPKLLDFGIAKMLDFNTDSTLTGMRMLTPDYASPEQVTGGPVTTATDTYSLGAVLYKLLTDSSPHQFENDSAAAISSTICEGRIIPAAQLVPILKGDLEMILMKALRREPQERYATIDQLSEDLENYLESRPIRARKGEVWYRTRKFMRRYWIPVTAATLTVASLTTGLALANRERRISQRRFMEVRQLSNKLFDIDLEASKVAGNARVRQLIVDTSLDYLRRLSSDRHQDADLELELGSAYFRVARVQGLPNQTNLGQIDQAEASLGTAEKFIDSVLAEQPSNRTAILRKAQIVHGRLGLLMMENREKDAHLLTPVLDRLLDRFKAGRGDIAEQGAILGLYGSAADQYTRAFRFEDSLRITHRAEELAKVFGNTAYLGTLHYVEGDTWRLQGNLDQALKVTTEAVAMLQPKPEGAQPSQMMGYIMSLIRLGRVLGDEHGLSFARWDEAAAMQQRAFDVADEYVHKDRNDQLSRGRFALAALDLAKIVGHSDPDWALKIYDHLLLHMAENAGNQSFRRYEVNALAGMSYPLRRLGRLPEARARLDSAFEKLRELHDYPADKIEPSSQVDETLCALAEYEAGKGNIAISIEIYRRLLDRILAWPPHPEENLEDACDLSRVWGTLASMYRRGGRAVDAIPLEAKRLELWQRWDARLPNNKYIQGELKAAAAARGDRALSTQNRRPGALPAGHVGVSVVARGSH